MNFYAFIFYIVAFLILVTTSDIIIQQTQIEQNKQANLDLISNTTNKTIDDLKVEYAGKIETSKGFGYIAISNLF